jgi:hypothetical protein
LRDKIVKERTIAHKQPAASADQNVLMLIIATIIIATAIRCVSTIHCCPKRVNIALS